MKSCTICGELREELELEKSPSGSGKLLCAECAGEVELDLVAEIILCVLDEV